MRPVKVDKINSKWRVDGGVCHIVEYVIEIGYQKFTLTKHEAERLISDIIRSATSSN